MARAELLGLHHVFDIAPETLPDLFCAVTNDYDNALYPRLSARFDHMTG